MTKIELEQIDHVVAEGLRLIGLSQDVHSSLPNIPKEVPTEKPKVTTAFLTSIGDSTGS